MVRLLIHVEGETEETFVNDLLADHLYNYGYEIVGARIIKNARLREKEAAFERGALSRKTYSITLRKIPAAWRQRWWIIMGCRRLETGLGQDEPTRERCQRKVPCV
jgi:hypothetical protein